MGRTGHHGWWNDSQPDCEFNWHVHSDSDQLGKRLHEHGDCTGESEHYSSGCERNRWTADLHDNVSGSLCCNDRRHRLQLGRTGHHGWWYDSQPDCEFNWHVHSDGDKLGKRLHEHGDCTGESEHHSSWCECNRWTADLYNNVSGSLCSNDIGHGLRMGRTGHRLWRHNCEPESELNWNIYSDSNQLG